MRDRDKMKDDAIAHLSDQLIALAAWLDSLKTTVNCNPKISANPICRLAYVNNILVVVFAEQFFGIQSVLLPALYNIPYRARYRDHKFKKSYTQFR
jgi:hypothetical protein